MGGNFEVTLGPRNDGVITFTVCKNPTSKNFTYLYASENYKNNLSLHIHFFLFVFHYFPDRVVGFTTYLRFMTKAAKNSDCALRDCKLYKQSIIAYPYISPRMTESQDGAYAHNAMRDCFEQDMINDRL